jgi:DNA-binding CsgD family transcriptional regulator
VLGASLYWGVNVAGLSGWNRPDQRLLGLLEPILHLAGFPLTHVVLVFLMLACTLISDVFKDSRATNLTAIIACVSNTLAIMGCILIVLLPSVFLNTAIAVGLLVLRALGTGALMLLWGLWFACLNKREAVRMVVPTSLLGVLICYLCLFFFLSEEISPLIPSVGYAVSAICFLMARFSFARKPRDFNRKKLKEMGAFYLSRALAGLAIGLSGQLLFTIDEPFLSVPAIIGGLVAFLLVSAWQAKNKGDAFKVAPLLPLLLAGFVVLPYLPHGILALTALAAALIWFCWVVLSSFQLSNLKDRFGIDEARLSFSEKTVVMLFWLIGALLVPVSVRVIPGELLDSVNNYFSVALVYFTILTTTGTIWYLVYERRQGELVEELSRPHREQLKRVYDEVARDYKLSAREREVLEMLAEGHTRSYIKDALVISDGTAKAHIAHVYQKLGVHKKEELYRMIPKH